MKDAATEPPRYEKLVRPSSPYMDSILGVPHHVLDHGHVRVIDYMGDEAAVVQSARISYGRGVDTPKRDVKLLRYLMRHMHTTPFEMCEIKLHAKLPVFVARQWLRHRTANINEISGRYTELPGEFYLPDAEHLARQSTDNKQGRDAPLSPDEARTIRESLNQHGEVSFDLYRGFVSAHDLAMELARINLPLSTYTEFYWKIDLHNLLHFLKLRIHPHAQYEIRVYAESLWGIIENWLPNIALAFTDYSLSAHTFSGPEMEYLRFIARKELRPELDEVDRWTDRERSAFLTALGMSESP